MGSSEKMVRAMRMASIGGAVLLAAGCSISASSASISDSITGSSKSFSDSISSSSPDGSSKSEQAYREDVRDYTATAARSGRDAANFQSGLARVAASHGVTDWEADASTFVGIGEGLARAGVDPADVAEWSRGIGATGGESADLIERGYAAGSS